MNTRIKTIINTAATTLGFAAPFPVATIGNIMRSFQNTMNELDRVINEQRDEQQAAAKAAESASQEMLVQENRMRRAEAEEDRAARIYDRLEDMLD